jgi:mannose-6-phosphate isomerase-like protein (cupin superfamily)
MAKPPVTAEEYAAEPVRFPAMRVVDLAAESAAVTKPYRNMALLRVNGSCLRLAVFNQVFAWHYHPTSDELFVVLEGCLAIDLVDGGELRLGPLEAATVPAGTVHRTRAIGRTVNLCFEEMAADTIFVEGPESHP